MYKCDICSAEFDEPVVCTERRPDADGYSEVMRYEHCPFCCEGYFHEMSEEEEDE